ncbi:MAG: hypothetical protein H6709_12235 [Kofleriaceae bacterium]|nr:hypothetical protein [Myxococcales bacterium]MCB9565412.1 hypothetical protein [Kofleriaceae bacterium]MCB9572846.1 hypothetical protein [Kofleriaceae bacterium]
MTAPASGTKRARLLGGLAVATLFVGVAGVGLWFDCRNERNSLADERKGMGCLLGGRPLPRDQVRARLDSVARGMAARGESRWPRVCAAYFDRAKFDADGAWGRRLADADAAVASGDLDAIAVALLALYDDVDFAQPE